MNTFSYFLYLHYIHRIKN